MTKARGDTQTLDLFDVSQMFPVEVPQELMRAMDFNVGLACAMRQAIRESGLTNDQVAARMTELLGYDDNRRITGAQLYAYTAASRDTHTISLVRFKAFVRATGCLWLWEVALDGEGLTLLQGEEALHAQASVAEKQGRELLEQAKRLRAAAPVQVHRRRR